MINAEKLKSALSFLPYELREEILKEGIYKQLPKGAELLREGQHVQWIPLVMEGLVKVVSHYEERELLLYYIQPLESCIMSFAAAQHRFPSRVYATTEEESGILLIPASLVSEWIRQYPALRDLFFRQYHQRYEDLLDTIRQLLFERVDKRLMDYLEAKARLLKTRELKLRHREIAADLGTAREVVSRLLKKLEAEGKVRQLPQGVIRIL